MGESGQEIEYPSLEDICRINRRLIQASGGLFVPPLNLINRDAVEYVLDIISAPPLGINPYTTLAQKAAALSYHIISRHAFVDGNKRTGVFAAWEFLRINGVDISLDSSVDDVALEVATGHAGIPDIEAWLIRHIVKPGL